MQTEKENRISKLERHRTIAQTEEYCPCTCHEKTLGDFMNITDEYAEIVSERIEKQMKLFEYSLEKSKKGIFIDVRKDEV